MHSRFALRAQSPVVAITFAFGALSAWGCDRSPPEPIRKDTLATGIGSATSTGDKGETKTQGAVMPTPPRPKPQVAPDDPLQGKWSLEDAVKTIPGGGALIATLDTSKGTIQCKLFEDKAPITVANFVGLATGKRTWKDPRSSKWVNTPAYDNTTFHRVIQGFMIQGGDAAGNGTGDPGYIIPDELWEGGKHDRAGLLCMANRGPNTNGAQFFITDAKAKQLDVSYTIFGECAPEDVVHQIAGVEKDDRDKPLSPITLKKVTIARADKEKKK